MHKEIQLEFDFSSTVFTNPVAIEKVQALLVPITFPNGAVPIGAIEWENTVVLDKGKRGVRAIPMSQSALQKLIIITNTGDPGKRVYGQHNRTYLDGLLSYESLMNFGGLDKGSPLINLFNRNGLDVVLTRAAHSYLNKKLREFKRLVTPYDFYVPEQFTIDKDGESVKLDRGGIEGPFVSDVYASEIIGYKKKITKFGFDDKTKEFHLFPFQIKDVARLACKRFAFIGLEQGLGKTPISIALCHMHGHKRVLIVCPGPAIGSWKSGWRHELHRMGVPKENIHVMRDAEDLPFDFKNEKMYPDTGRPHFFLTDYGTMARDMKAWSSYTCPDPQCLNLVMPEDKGYCNGPLHPKNTSNYPQYCMACYTKNGSNTINAIKAWNGRICDENKGGCGWKIHGLVVNKGRVKKGITNPKPMFKRIKRNMFQVALFDESQMVKNADTKRGHAVQHIPGLKRSYVITGTMMTNYIHDTYWQLNLLFNGRFPVEGAYRDYSTRKGYKEGHKCFLNDFQCERGGKTSLPVLNNKESLWSMMSTVQIRRHAIDPEVDNQIHLPSLSLHTELIQMDADHDMVYNMKTGEFQRELQATLRAAGRDVKMKDLGLVNIEKQINILRMIACAPEMEIAYRREMTNKDARILQLVEEENLRGGKTVIFSSFRAFTEKMRDMCKMKGYDPITIDGTNPIESRWPLIDIWRSDPSRKVMIAGIKSMNYAVNFTSVCNQFDVKQVIFATPDWVPSEMEQAWKRIHRIGQNKDVNAYFIYLKDTVEEYMDEVLYQKRRTIATAMDRVEDVERDDSQIQRSATEIAEMVFNKMGVKL